MGPSIRLVCFVLLAAAAPLATTACSSVDSEHVKTSGIWAHFHVEHRIDDVVVAFGVLKVGGGGLTDELIDLTGGEHLECNGVALTEFVDPITRYRWNRAEVPMDAEGYYLFSFVRTDEVVDTDVFTPEVPTILDLDPADVVNDGGQVAVTWDVTTPGTEAAVWVQGPCIADIGDVGLPDDGEHTSSNVYSADPDNPEACETSVTVVRTGQGDVSGKFLGGYASATIADAVGLDFEP